MPFSSICPRRIPRAAPRPAFDQLSGSRMIVANAELRFPVFGLLNPNGGFYGGFPLDPVAFVDAGVA